MAFGGGGSNRQRGCCNPCCAKSFDEDAFDAAVAKDMQKTRDPNAPMQTTPEMAAKPATT
ncbi:hypothetical protein BDZ89DRAFT_1062419 [Hymenopellis radicata]|nr:hypothetical protein BDZ89DRAFT_1062419 [Hymenopellis radicata]